MKPSTAHLARLGFADAGRLEPLLRSEALANLVDGDGASVRRGKAPAETTPLLEALADTADPDAALLGLVRLLDAAAEAGDAAELRVTLTAQGPERDRLLGVLGISAALADHLAAHPGHWRAAAHAHCRSAAERVAHLVAAVSTSARGERSAHDALRVAYREQMLEIVALDATTPDPLTVLPQVGVALADLAAAALEAALVIAVQEHPAEGARTRLAVIGMGKCGGRELNYVSDVDVVFVAEPADGVAEDDAIAAATTLATSLMRACSAATGEGSLWQVDAALRPEGKQGPLVRTVASHRQYYQRWAKTWEFQALLKARHIAGDPDVGTAYERAMLPLVWQAAGRDHFVEDVQAMRRRVEAHVPTTEAARQLKLGPGGLRDVEFSVQLLQLVHGRADDSLRSASTLEALGALSAGGYVGRAEAAKLDTAYRFLRATEHRIQAHRMRRTHLMPTAAADLRRLGRSLGFRSDPAAEIVQRRREESLEVRRIHEKLFYRPLLAAAAKLTTDDVRLTEKAARERLAALGYRDPAGALRHIGVLTSGVTRTAAIHRQLLPVILGWFADEADPDAGLLAYRKVSESLGGTPWYARMLRDEGYMAERLAHVLARSRFAGDMLVRMPDAVRILGEPDGLVPRSRERLVTTMRSAIGRQDDAAGAIEAARVIRRHELFRISVADMVGELSLAQAALATTDLTEALVECALSVATTKVGIGRGAPVAADIALIGMGRFGGQEMCYASDADVLAVFRPHEGADATEAAEAVTAVIVELRRMLREVGPDPQLELDVDLRPEGKAGPLARTIGGYRGYYERWAQTWEFHALLRARPVAGDPALGAEFVSLANPLRYRPGGLDESQLRDIRRLKARMEGERLPRGADPKGHVKLGPGGLSDVEWTVQLVQLQHAYEVPGLRTTQTLAALDAAVATGHVAELDAKILAEAWALATAIRDAGMLWRGRPTDSLPTDLRDLEGISRILLRPGGEGPQLRDSYRRAARRARQVTERLFYGRDPAHP
ncbi:MAG: bifunctional [glutamine synthetase] adenylyltransferase/[glutamine synthetase]-adenylyl-L-tyrosine phosphorylase [Dermatophilaceae bacterium]